MTKFYCRATVGDDIFWEYRKARNVDQARRDFSWGIKEEDRSHILVDVPNYIIVSRLLEFVPDDLDPWGCDVPFTLHAVSEATDADIKLFEAEESYQKHTNSYSPSRQWHAARILWMTQNPESLTDPIELDNHCHMGRIYPVPEITDGWHRLYAHKYLGSKKIPALYGGRADLLDYLSGKTDKCPE